MLKDAPILLLDEATSALDNEASGMSSGAEGADAGPHNRRHRHRLSTIIGADLICVMDRGRIVETGKHAQLLAHNGLYRRLYETEFTGEAEAAASVLPG